MRAHKLSNFFDILRIVCEGYITLSQMRICASACVCVCNVNTALDICFHFIKHKRVKFNKNSGTF